MNGAESLINTLVNGNVTVCFTNPGTSEMHFVAALDEVQGMRCILCLFEGVVSGAADGYARMAERPASTLLHLGPGYGNAVANVHNARKGGVPMVNVIGDHATYHLEYDAPLTSDIEGLAAPMSHWVYTSRAADDIARDAAQAVLAAGRGQIASLILPADVSWGENPGGAVTELELPAQPQVDAARIAAGVAALRSGKRCMILVGGRHISRERTHNLSRLSKATGARVCAETFPTRLAHGAGSGTMERLPYLAEFAIDFLKDIEHILLIGVAAPVSFFAYPNVPSVLYPEGCEISTLASDAEDIDDMLQQLLAALDASEIEPDLRRLALPELPEGDLDANSMAAVLARRLPENAIMVDEGNTSALSCFSVLAGAAPHDWLCNTGGSIGWGLPAAVGAAVACPDRKVVCMEGDGSAMYTIQALWTMAREQLDVVVLLFANRKYSILELEFSRTGARGGSPGPKAASMLDIGNPVMDFVQMSEGMGVAATRAATVAELDAQLAAAVAAPGPCLIEVVLPTVF